MRADEPDDDFELDWAPVWPNEAGHLEPIFFEGPQWIEFPEVEPAPAALEPATAGDPLLVEFEEFALEEFALLDAAEGDEEPEEPPLPAGQRASAASLAASFGVHLLTLLVLIAWHSAPAEVAGAIPVRLVIENPSGVSAEKVAGQSVAASADQAPRTDSGAVASGKPPPPPPQTQVASVTPPARPRPPPPRPAAAPSRPAPERRPVKPTPPPPPPPPPPPQAAALPRVPAVAAPARAAPAPAPAAPAPAPAAPSPAAAGSPASAPIAVERPGAAPNAAAAEGDYFAQLEQLTRPYLYMLSSSFLAGRRGRTTLTITVGDDGTIGHIGVKRSSGYPDIDARIEQMVEAVGRFPPLPQQLRRPGADLDFNLVFPEVLQQ